MFVYNNFTHDSRVLKEATTLSDAGYDVRVIALLDNSTDVYQQINGFRVIRVAKDPIHLKFLRFLSNFIMEQTSNNNYQSSMSGIKAHVQKIYLKIKEHDFHYIFLLFSWLMLLFYKLVKICLFIVSRLFFKSAKVVFYKLKSLLMKFHRPLCFLDYYIRAYRILSQEPGNIYHAHDLNTLPIAFWASKRHAAKLVYDSHELYVDRNQLRPPSRMGKFLLQRLESYFIRRSNAVITVNEAIANELAKRYRVRVPDVVMNTPSKKMEINTSNDNLLRKALGINKQYYIMLYCGVMTFNRGLDKVIKSLVYLPNYHLIFMGYGTEDYKNYLQNVAYEAKVQDRFSFFGPVPSKEVTLYAAGADLGVAPIENACLSYYYCSPNKVFEYISAGLPVIGSNFPELKRVILNYEIGYTFQPNDPADIARAAREVLDNKDKWIKMKHNTKLAAKEYNWEKESLKLLSLYHSLS